MPKNFTLEKKLYAQVRYYETLHVIRDKTGERIYTGSEATARRIQGLLNRHASTPASKTERLVRAKRQRRRAAETKRRQTVRRRRNRK